MNNNKKLQFNFTLIILILFSNNIFSQNYTISGFVSDIESGEKLINASVIQKGTNNAVFTNQFGYFSLNIKNQNTNKIIVFASYIAYKADTLIIDLENTKEIEFQLKSITTIDSIVVTSQIPTNRTTDVGMIEIPVSQLKIMPAIGGESDIFKALQLLPGIQAGNEGSSNLYVRGGSPDENLILLDDIPLYYVNHLGGFISVFNTDAIKSVQVYKGGFPARFGSRLSSVIDIRMKDGDMKKYNKDFTLGIVNTKFLIEGPIIKDKISFIVSARYLPWELLLRPFFFLVNEGQMIGYNFHDINAKINYKINNKNHIYFSFYTGNDNMSFRLSDFLYPDSKLDYNMIWGNMLGALRWNSIITDKFSLNTSLAYTRFRYKTIIDAENKIENSKFYYNFNTGIKDVILNSTADYNISRYYKLKSGANFIYHNFNPGITTYNIKSSDSSSTDTTFGFNSYNGLEFRAFVENNFSIGEFLKANIGFHFSDYFIEQKHFLSYQPRIVLNFLITKNFSFKTSYSEMMQYVHLLTSNSLGLNPDLWIPATEKMPPSNSKQISAGFYQFFDKNNYELSIEGYYKLSDNLISYKEGAVFSGNAENWQDKLEVGGKGVYYGVELFFQKKQGRTTGWISYTYARATHQFENINYGKPYPFKYDRRHDFSIVVNHNITDNITFSGTWVFGTGYPYTMPIGRYNIVNEGYNPLAGYNQNLDMFYNQNVLIYADRNQYRMRSYHRLDVAMNFSKKVKKGIRTWSISIYNVYSRQNPYFYYTKFDKNTNKYSLFQQSLFPIIPSVSYSFKF